MFIWPNIRSSFRNFSSKPSSFYKLSKDVELALRKGKPVVALESTIITHGMPFPENLQTAIEIEDIVRSNGCVPATVAIIDGFVKIGIDAKELEFLAKTGQAAIKTSRRDMALVVAQKSVGATTVSATMVAANQVGIKVFVTGGIGGVHRGAETNFDISADLTELGRTPMAVICAGVKSILDVEKTLEYLETQGVTVVNYGKSNDFPEFYVPRGKLKAMKNLETIQECADLINANQSLNLKSGMVIAVPVPDELAFSDPIKLELVIQKAVSEAKLTGIKGKDITPFLLGKVKELTGGESLKTNIALVKNNAKIGSQIARKLTDSVENIQSFQKNSKTQRPVIFGCVAIDIIGKTDASLKSKALNTSSPGVIEESMGGVGRNIAESCSRSGGNPLLIGAVGEDPAGDWFVNELNAISMDTSGIITIGDQRTATYNALLHSDGELIAAVADMRINSSLNPALFKDVIDSNATIVAIDANISKESIDEVIKLCSKSGIPLLFEPTSVSKSLKIFESDFRCVKFVTPDAHEAKTMADKIIEIASNLDDTMNPRSYQAIAIADMVNEFRANNSKKKFFEGVEEEYESLLKLLTAFENVIVKCGSRGCLVGSNTPVQSDLTKIKMGENEKCISYLRAREVDVVNVNGAGDSLVGVVLSGLSNHYKKKDRISHQDFVKLVSSGMRAAELTLRCSKAVSPDINPKVLQ